MRSAFFIRIAIMLILLFALATVPQNIISILPQTFAHTKSNIHAQRVTFPVTVLGEQHTMSGVLYVNPSQHKICLHKATPRKVEKCFLKLSTLQVLVHGWTYNHTYWDPYGAAKPGRSYARFMAKKGYAILALDLLGTGASSVPDGAKLNFTENVHSLVQVLTSIRTQQHLQDKFIRRIALVGHSGGTILSVLTAASAPNLADFLIATGWSYVPHPVFPKELIDLALGQTPYISFPDNVRAQLFYYTPSARPRRIAFDNKRLADQLPNGSLREGLPLLDALKNEQLDIIKAVSLVDKVTVPVLVQLGDMDVIAPPLVPENEKELYAGSPDVTVQVLDNIGHSFNLHNNRKTGWQQIHRWLKDQLFH